MSSRADDAAASTANGEEAGQALPEGLVRLLDGTDLAQKVGQTILLIAAEPDGWPRLALLSVGEVLAVSPTELRLGLYPASGTTRALTESGKALLGVVLDGTSYRIRVVTERVPHEGRLACFHGRVVAVDPDRVGYATIRSGITYDLPDRQGVVERWSAQISMLRGLAP